MKRPAISAPPPSRLTLLSAALLLPAWAALLPGTACAEVIEVRNPEDVTHTITSRGVTLGMSEKGGGYINYLNPGGNLGNIVSPGFGRGIQIAMRDYLHNGRYNPTQAGARDLSGAPANISTGTSSRGGSKLSIGRFAVPLYLNDIFDFTENEDITNDHPAFGKDGGNSDTDNLPEPGKTMADEVKSELDFFGYVQDAASLAPTTTGAAVFECVYTVDFKRDADAMLQFGAQARLYDGSNLLLENNRLTDLAPTLSGAQEARDFDLSVFSSSLTVHLSWDAGYKHLFWLPVGGSTLSSTVVSDEFNQNTYISGSDVAFANLFTRSTQPERVFKSNPIDNAGSTRSDLIILGRGTTPSISEDHAVGVYFPRGTATNLRSFTGLTKSGNTSSYREDRLMYQRYSADRSGGDSSSTYLPPKTGPDGPVTLNNDISVLSATRFYTGMIAPDGKTNYERLRQQMFLIIGTPAQIKAAAEEIADNLNL